jgi:predicted regulator of Ras-like GTPase activity (Roadblock/LC7/MglB family)
VARARRIAPALKELAVLTSLFGDLGPASDRNAKKRAAGEASDHGFAATAIMESVATEVNDRGQMVDRHSHDLVVSGSPAQAIRDHFANTRADLETATSLITLLDPAGVWASAVIKALSDAGGRPIERLHLREHTTLRTLATIERTMLVRRHEDTLRVYYADVRTPGTDSAEIPVALMERSQMSTVIIGPLQPHAIDGLLVSLHAAVMLPTWRCPNLLFLLPPNAVWIANKINAIAWPGRLRVHVLSESMTGASSVWNAMLGMWNQVKGQPGWDTPPNPALMGMNEFPIKVAEIGGGSRAPVATPPVAGTAPAYYAATAARASPPAPIRLSRAVLDPERAKAALTGMLALDGLLGCAVVDATTGLALAREATAQGAVDMDLVAASSAQVMRAHRQAARSMGLGEQVDEIMTSAGPRQQVMRTLSRQPELFLVVLLEKHRTNLALARFQLMEVERGLA